MYSFGAPLDPDERVDFPADWSKVLGSGETIQTSSWTLPADAVADGLTKISDGYSGTATTIFLTGGVAGKHYDLVNTVTTIDGGGTQRTRQRTCRLRIKDK